MFFIILAFYLLLRFFIFNFPVLYNEGLLLCVNQNLKKIPQSVESVHLAHKSPCKIYKNCQLCQAQSSHQFDRAIPMWRLVAPREALCRCLLLSQKQTQRLGQNLHHRPHHFALFKSVYTYGTILINLLFFRGYETMFFIMFLYADFSVELCRIGLAKNCIKRINGMFCFLVDRRSKSDKYHVLYSFDFNDDTI